MHVGEASLRVIQLGGGDTQIKKHAVDFFHAEIARQEGRFTLQEIYDRLCKKLIFRHPNLFEGTKPMDWQELKRLEKGQKTLGEDLDGIAKTLPALTRAEKIAGKLDAADQAQNLEELGKTFADMPNEENLGKLLFAACAAAKQAKIDPETLAVRICDHLTPYLQSGDNALWLQGYRDRFLLSGMRVECITAGDRFPATVLGIDDTGALLVTCDDGTQHTLYAGEVSLGATDPNSPFYKS